MIVTENTKYRDFAPVVPFIEEEQEKQLMDAAERLYGFCNMLTIDQFFGLMDGDYQLLGDMDDPSVLQAYWLQRFERFCANFSARCEELTMPPTAEQQKASAGTKPLDYKASVLVFIRDYFGLHSFVDCGHITLGEYLTARQDKFNAQVVQRNYNRMQEQKFKKNRR